MLYYAGGFPNLAMVDGVDNQKVEICKLEPVLLVVLKDMALLFSFVFYVLIWRNLDKMSFLINSWIPNSDFDKS